MSATHKTRSPLLVRPVVREHTMAGTARSAAGETLPGACVRREGPAQVALTDLARLLGRRAAMRHRQSAGLANLGLGPVLGLVALAATAALIGLSLFQGR